MAKIQKIFCPNCGSRATKYTTDSNRQRTSCEYCDYLLVQCVKTGRVIEAYAPGVDAYCAIDAAPVSA